MSCDNQSLGIILVRSLRKVGAPFVEVSFEGAEISGKALKLKLRDVLRLLSANVEIRLFHLDNGREFSDHETAPTYTYLTYTLARTSARSGFHAGSEIPTHVAALLHNNDVSSFLPTSRTNVGSVSLSSNCSAESSEGNLRAPSGGSVAPTQRLKSVSDRLLLFGSPRKVLENFMQCKGDVASLCSHSADRTQLSQNDILHCPLCSFSLHLPLRTPCCRAIACQPCLTYAQTNNLDPGMTECCPFCLAALDLKNVKTDPELLKQVQNLAKRQREDASHIDNRNSCEESSKISEETSLPRSAIISQSEFDLLRALEKEFILQKRKGTAVPNSEFTSEISLSREEVALAKRVQQSIASNGDIPMPFLTDAQRHRIEAHLALSSVGNSAPKK